VGRDDTSGTWNRRQFVLRSAVAASVVWKTPTVLTVRPVGAAGTPAPGSTPTSSTVTAPPPRVDVLITGGGSVDQNTFGFNARTNATGPSGQLNYMFRNGSGPPTQVHSAEVTSVTVLGNRATVAGTASVDRTSGFTFRVDVLDGEPDAFAIVVLSSDGSVIHQIGTHEQPVPLGGGSIQIHEASD
jgi:hypothetical protein